jgi:hypothetical protein
MTVMFVQLVSLQLLGDWGEEEEGGEQYDLPEWEKNEQEDELQEDERDAMDMHYRQTQADAEVLAEEKRLSQIMDGESDHEDGVGNERSLRGGHEEGMAGDERMDIPQVDGEGGEDDKERAKQTSSASSKLLDKARKLKESSKFQKRGSFNALTMRPVRVDGKDGVEIGGSSSKCSSKSTRGKEDSGTRGILSRGRKGRDGEADADAGQRGGKSKVGGDAQMKEKVGTGVHEPRQDMVLAQKGTHRQEAHRRSIEGEGECGDSAGRLLNASMKAKGGGSGSRGSRSRTRHYDPTLSPTDMVFYEPGGKRSGENQAKANGKGERLEATEIVLQAEEDAFVQGSGSVLRPSSSASRTPIGLERAVAGQMPKRHGGEGDQVVGNVEDGNVDATEVRDISVSRADMLQYQYPGSREGRNDGLSSVPFAESRSDGHDAVFATPRPVAKKADVSSPGVSLSITQLSHQQSPPIATLEPSVANGPTQLTAQQSLETPSSNQVMFPLFSLCVSHE